MPVHQAVDPGHARPSFETLPTGAVTFVFTDIEGSTRLVRRLGVGYADVLEVHDALISDAFVRAGGVMFGSRGDALFAAFADPTEAMVGALDAQHALRAHRWNDHELRVRIGIHSGEAVARRGTYVGLDVHRVARICAAARGGQILVSADTAAATATCLPAGARLIDLGLHPLKDLPGPHRLYELTR
jgi:class 3 adenylate cyclase